MFLGTSTPFNAPRHAALATLFSLVLAACGGSSNGDDGGGGSEAPPPPAASGGVPTATGNAAGTAVSQTMGAAGGRLELEGGRVTLEVPAGALTQDTTITAQPITNHAHGGTGQAWRFSPENVRFAKPVVLSFRYGDSELEGSAPEALGIAFQRPGGVWEWVGSPRIDTTARTVSISTDHFSDWSLVQGMQLRPVKANVAAGKTLALQVMNCFTDYDQLLAPIVGHPCRPEPPTGGKIKEWTVNGQPGGSAGVGTISGDQQGATYTAPGVPPSPHTVTASARVDLKRSGQMLLLSHITITPEADYVGTVTFDHISLGGSIKGTTNVSWKLLETMSSGQTAIRYYAPSGTTDLDLQLEGCDPRKLSLPIDGSFAASQSQGAPFLRVNTVDKVYQFTLRHAGTVTLQCGEPREPFELAGSDIVLAMGFAGAGSCENTLPPFPFTNLDELSGQGTCPDTVSASWRFLAGK